MSSDLVIREEEGRIGEIPGVVAGEDCSIDADGERASFGRREACDFDVFERGPALPKMERYWITARSLAAPMTKRLWRSMSA